MAKKKVVKKKQSTKKEVISPEMLEKLTFKEVKEGMSDDEIISSYQHNIQLMNQNKELIIAKTMIDAKDTIVLAAVARITLIERKMLAMATKINQTQNKKLKEEAAMREEGSAASIVM
jgi:hypothetical protein